jgi:hypothetical protein
MGGCHSSQQVLSFEPMPIGQCLCGIKVFDKVLNHTCLEHQLAQIILDYHNQKFNTNNEDLGSYIWTLQFIKDRFKSNCVLALLSSEDYPQNIFPESFLNQWAFSNDVYSFKRNEDPLLHTI